MVGKTLTVSPKSDMMTTGKLKSQCCEEEESLSEPKLTDELGFLVETAMGKSHRGKIPVCVANHSTETQVSYQGTVIGTFETVVAVLQKDPGSERLDSVRILNSNKTLENQVITFTRMQENWNMSSG